MAKAMMIGILAAGLLISGTAACLAGDTPLQEADPTEDIGEMISAELTRVAPATQRGRMPTNTPLPSLPDTPTPDPTNTPRPGPTATPMPSATPTSRPTYTPFPTPTPRPTNTPIVASLVPTPMPIPERLPTVECNPPCDHDYEPTRDYVEWELRPSVSSAGVLTLLAHIDAGIDFIFPNGEGASFSNIALTSATHGLLGAIVPLAQPDWHWTPEPGLWVASEYRYSNSTLSVRAQIDPAAATHPGLRLCVWSGGTTDEQNQVLDCVPVQQP